MHVLKSIDHSVQRVVRKWKARVNVKLWTIWSINSMKFSGFVAPGIIIIISLQKLLFQFDWYRRANKMCFIYLIKQVYSNSDNDHYNWTDYHKTAYTTANVRCPSGRHIPGLSLVAMSKGLRNENWLLAWLYNSVCANLCFKRNDRYMARLSSCSSPTTYHCSMSAISWVNSFLVFAHLFTLNVLYRIP